ncbi:helix-turn-helix transcriptional regulator [Pseudobacter ginsenosidimutans]|uniref:AraC-like DNA-binding protein n=1 Tax=Pseudobacter ginsenosidimutans TaxID=661488 RepID=A0A4Q7N442_9BACT|nr:helix-turn-helix transcriptional regulator [Pseudobacter ginsenosidimutans]QEC44293.1 helix-turn-helix transcriptional regulator [Pseudobacter ginsenosidimutans]RZS75754.1 AraC-like DNA-binding protein [Pseudobacter ginsenosidimutans]
MQLPPSPHIAHIVKHYLVLKAGGHGDSVHRLFADGNTGIVFNLAAASLKSSSDAASMHSCWLYGQLNSFRDLTLSGSIHWVIVVLQPYGAYHLWNVPATEWKDSFFPAQEVLGNAVENIGSRLQQAASVSDCIGLLNAWLFRISEKMKQPDPLMLQAIQQIRAGKGSLPVHVLLKQLQVNERMLERKFKLNTGVTPKQYSGIVRMNASARKLKQLQYKESLTAIAYENNYFDQAHFIKDFRKYTGITPWQYQHTVAPLALNFLRL